MERKIKSNYFLGEKQGVFTTEVSIFKMRSCIEAKNGSILFQNYILFSNYDSVLFTNTNAKIVLLKMNSFMRVTKVFKIVSRDGAGGGGGGGRFG